MTQQKNRQGSSQDSLAEATRYRAVFSGHANAKGAAGYVSDTDDNACNFLGTTGDSCVFERQPGGYGKIRIGAAWQNLIVQEAGFFGRLFKKMRKQGVDLDLGCLYELKDGTRGCLQAFGESHGSYDEAPYICLSRDDRTGDDDDDDDGEDEILLVNGAKWPEIKRILFYIYIYGGAEHWAKIKPQIQIRMPDSRPMIVNLHTYKSALCLCAVAEMVNERGGIKLINHTEYYPGHAEMDRAFGFGIDWTDGRKD